MQNFGLIVEQILILALTMGLGYATIKMGYLGNETKEGLPKLIIRLLVPMLILSSITNLDMNSDMVVNGIWVAVLAVVLIVAGYLISMIFAKLFGLTGATRYIHGIIASCGNVIFLGYPVIQALFGEVGLFYAMIYSVVNDTLLWTVGLLLLAKGDKKPSFKMITKSLLNPETVTFTASVIMLAFGIKLPPVLGDVVGGIGGTTTYLSMLYVGMVLTEVNLFSIWKRFEIYSIVFVKMLLLPILAVFILKFTGINSLAILVVAIQAAMPAQIIATILAKTYNADPVYAAECVVITILFSLVTLPLVYMIATSIMA